MPEYANHYSLLDCIYQRFFPQCHSLFGASGAMDAAVAAAQESHKQQLAAVKASALASLAYLQLQQQHWKQALAYSEQLLKV